MKKIVCLLSAILFTTLVFAQKPLIQDIQARAGKGTKINISWTLPVNSDKQITKFIIYRDIQQITTFNQINNLTPIAEISPEATGYTDTVKDYKDYFYAVVAYTDRPYDLILLSFNSTVTGTHVAMKTEEKIVPLKNEEKLYPEGTLRETPLPYVDLVEGFNKVSDFSEETMNHTNTLITSEPEKEKLLKPYIFEEDLISPDAGDDYFLFEILKTTFVQRKYNEAITQLNKLLGTNVSESTRNRAIFYLGESEYLLGHYDNAVRLFVKVQTVFPVVSKKWLDSALINISK